jgi:hypothetical protein
MSSHHQHYAAGGASFFLAPCRSRQPHPVSDFVPAESWDDDFEFQQNNPHAHTNATTHPPKHKPKPAPMPPHEPLPRMSTTTTTSSHFAEDWDVEHDAQSPPQPPRPPPASIVVLEDKMNYYHHHNPHHRASQLADWAEPGPSTPTKRSVPSLTENWDDDFEDRTDSPARKSAASHPLDNARRSRHLTPSRVRRHAPPVQDQESWDDEFEAEKPHDGVDHSPGKRARRGACSDSSDEEGEFGFADKEEDRTVTARSHPRHAILARMTPPPPVPTLPSFLAMTSEPFPRSPVESVFSIPVSSTGHDHESVTYSSTAHLPLRPTLSVSSSALALLPPSPPIHRERRRLRKKSRPPQFDDNIFELEDRAEISVQTLLPPITPERVPSPPPTSPDPVSPSSNKNPLLSRIGSVKKWSVRKKRTSTTPSDTIPQENDGHDTTPRPPSSLSQSPVLANKPGNWFFRSSGGASPQYGSPPPTLGLSHSGDRIQYLNPSTVDETPDSPTKLIKRKSLGFSQIRKQLPVQELQPLAPKRPVSMLPDPKQRHASYAYGTHSSSEGPVPKVPGVESASVEDFGKGASQREGSRGFMSGVRKISFTGGQKKHKRRQSSAHSVAEAKASMPDDVQPLPHHGLQPLEPVEPPLPPIELQPPSPVSASGMQTSQSAPGLVSTGIGVVNIRTTSPPKAPPSPQTASLGRSTHAMAASAIVPRRNSLGDLKIPARISQAQVGLRRDLVMVREFAANVERGCLPPRLLVLLTPVFFL